MKYDVFVLMCACVVNKRLWRAQQALNAQCYKCQVMGVLACKCVHVRERETRMGTLRANILIDSFLSRLLT